MEGEVGVCAAEGCNKVVLEGADGALSSVATVDVGRRELVVNIVVGEEVAEVDAGLVVKALELWKKAAFGEEGVNRFVGSDDGRRFTIWKGLSNDGIAVVVVHN